MHVDAVEQRAGEAISVALYLVRAAVATVSDSIPQVTAGAGVHRSNQLEMCGKLCLVAGAGDGDFTALQGLPKYFEHAAIELRQFIQEQDAVVCQ